MSLTRCSRATGVQGTPNQALQRTAGAGPVPREFKLAVAPAAAELGRSAAECLVKAELASALIDLQATEASKRLAASRVIERAARMVSNEVRQKAMGRRAVTGALTKALGDTDTKVVQNAIIAVAEISRRYFKDDRVYPSVVRLLGSPDQLTRLWAASAAVVLREGASLPDVSPLVRDRSAKVRAEVVRLALGLAVHTDLSVAARSELRAMAAVATDDKDRQVQEFAANLMRALETPSRQRSEAEPGAAADGGA